MPDLLWFPALGLPQAGAPPRRTARDVGQPPIADWTIWSRSAIVRQRNCPATRLDGDEMEHCISLASQVDMLAPPRVSELTAQVGPGT